MAAPSEEAAGPSDPWTVSTVVAGRPWHVAAWVAALLGVAGPALRVLSDGDVAAALWLAVGVAAVWASALAAGRAWLVVLALVVALVGAAVLGSWWILLGTANVVVATLALGSAPWAAADRSAPPPALALPFVLLVDVVAVREGRVAIALAAVALGAAVATWTLARPGPADRAAEAVAKVIGAIGQVVAGLILAPIALVLYVASAVARALDLIRHRRRAGWVDRGWDAAAERRLAAFPFRAVPARARWRGHLLTGLVLLGALAAVLVLRPAPPAAGPRPSPIAADGSTDASEETFENRAATRFSDLPAFEGVEFADELQAEQQRLTDALPPDPLTSFTTGDFEGIHTTVQASERRSPAAPCPGCPAISVWLIGGSSAFGLGQRDAHTIAAEMQRIGAGSGIGLTVRNFAVPGWTHHQELLDLERRLDGTPPEEQPDIIISYGGYNDALATLMDAALGKLEPEEPAILRGDRAAELAALDPADRAPGYLEQAAEVGTERALRSLARLEELAASVGATPWMVFQPDALASPEQFAPVRKVYRGLAPGSIEPADQTLEAVSSRAQPGVVSLRHLYDEVDDSVFADWAHTNEQGAQIAAAALMDLIRPTLESIAPPG